MVAGYLCGNDVAAAQLVSVDADAAAAYVLNCRKENGAFGPADQSYTDAAWNYPAVATLLLLDCRITAPERILKHGLGRPSGHVGYGHWHFFHQHGIRELLNKPLPVEHRRVRLEDEPYATAATWGSGLGFGRFGSIGSAGDASRRGLL